MAAPTSFSVDDLLLSFLLNSLGLNPALAPVYAAQVAAGGAIGISDSTDQTVSGVISALNANISGPGAPTALSSIGFSSLMGTGNLSIQVQGAFVGTLILQVSNDNSNWLTLAGSPLYSVSSGAAIGNAISGAGMFAANVGSFLAARVTCSAYTSGAPVITLKISDTSPLAPPVAPINQIGGLLASTSGAAPNLQKILTSATTNATSVKTSSGKIFSMVFSNNAATARYVHLYSKASAPTVGTDSPQFTITLPPNTIAQPFVFSSDVGMGGFNTGIAYSITGLAGDLDATVTAANDVTGMIGYI